MREAKAFAEAGALAAAAILDQLPRGTQERVSAAVESGAALRAVLQIERDGESSVSLELVSDGRAIVVASLAGRHPTSSNSIQRN